MSQEVKDQGHTTPELESEAWRRHHSRPLRSSRFSSFWLRWCKNYRNGSKLAKMIAERLLPFYLTSTTRSNGAQTASEIIEFASARRTIPNRSSLGDRAFLVAAARAWNSLPSTVTAASTLHSFRRALKSHLGYSPHLCHHLSYIICILS